MDKESRDNKFIRKPIYPGGDKAYKAFIASNLVYPEEAKKHKVTGQVRLKYGINFKGEVTEVKVLSSLGYGCDEEAIRIVKLLKFDVPKGPRKIRVLFHRTVRISFKFTVEKKPKKPAKKPVSKPNASQSPAVTYSYVAVKSTKPKPAHPQKENTYQYTIKIK